MERTYSISDDLSTYVCDEVKEALDKFISREYEYYYAEPQQRKLFTLEDCKDFIHNPKKQHLSIQQYIDIHKLENKWLRLHIRETFNRKQENAFRNSNLTLSEFIEKHDLFENLNIDEYSDTDYNDSDIYNSVDEYSDLSEDDNSWGD